jgi:hypothetical protein
MDEHGLKRKKEDHDGEAQPGKPAPRAPDGEEGPEGIAETGLG